MRTVLALLIFLGSSVGVKAQMFGNRAVTNEYFGPKDDEYINKIIQNLPNAGFMSTDKQKAVGYVQRMQYKKCYDEISKDLQRLKNNIPGLVEWVLKNFQGAGTALQKFQNVSEFSSKNTSDIEKAKDGLPKCFADAVAKTAPNAAQQLIARLSSTGGGGAQPGMAGGFPQQQGMAGGFPQQQQPTGFFPPPPGGDDFAF